MRWRTRTNTRPLLAASVAACLLSLSLPSAGGKAPAEKDHREARSGADDAADIVRIYALKYTDCGAALDVLNPLLAGTSKVKPLRLVGDTRTNSLIAQGTASHHLKIEQLLKAIDTPRRPVAGKEMLVKVYPLRYAEAGGLAKAIAPLVEPVGKVTADAATRSLVVSATGELLDTVTEVVMQLDTKPRDTGEEMIVQAYSLKHAKADKLGAAVLPLLGPRGTIARDTQRNLLIIKDAGDVQRTAARLIEILDVPAAAGAMTQRRVQVVWLVSFSGLKDEEKPGHKLPPHLKEVEAELAKVGVEDLRVIAQLLATCVGTEEFRASGELDGPCRVTVKGQFVERSASAVALKIGITAEQLRPVDPEKPGGMRQYVDLAAVDSTITAPPGHAVVLAMSPMVSPKGTLTSVFVVIVSEGK
jgi:hypothetical protein